MSPRERGFSLVELLVVIVIIGILASLTMVGVIAAMERSRDGVAGTADDVGP